MAEINHQRFVLFTASRLCRDSPELRVRAVQDAGARVDARPDRGRHSGGEAGVLHQHLQRPSYPRECCLGWRPNKHVAKIQGRTNCTYCCTYLPAAYVVRQEGNVFTSVCFSVCPQERGTQVSVPRSLLQPLVPGLCRGRGNQPLVPGPFWGGVSLVLFWRVGGRDTHSAARAGLHPPPPTRTGYPYPY